MFIFKVGVFGIKKTIKPESRSNVFVKMPDKCLTVCDKYLMRALVAIVLPD